MCHRWPLYLKTGPENCINIIRFFKLRHQRPKRLKKLQIVIIETSEKGSDEEPALKGVSAALSIMTDPGGRELAGGA